MIYSTRIEWDVTKVRDVACVTLLAVENLESLQGIKIARWNEMLLFRNKIKKIYSPCLVSVVHLAYFIASFQNKTDEVMSGQSCFERPEPRGRFLAEIRIGCSIFAPNTKKEKSFVLFSGQLVKISLFSAPIRTIFALLFQFSSAPCYRWQRHSSKNQH